ncbi:MAG: TatD family hydrolase [Candidatus Odinarchaeia archaeon]
MNVCRMVDVHCHLDDLAFKKDLQSILENAYSKGVIAAVSSALGPESILNSIKLVESTKNLPLKIYLSFGLEPYNLSEEDFNKTVDLIVKYKNKIKGIGEVGLDFYRTREHSERDIQISRFIKFIELSKKLDLPLIVHSRSAGKKCLETLASVGAKKVLMHAFDGRAKYALEGVDLGYFFSIPTSVVRSGQKQKLVKALPLENILFETDSPVLAPVRGEVNTPENLPLVAEKVAEIKRVPIEKVCEIVYANSVKFFNLNP